MIYKSYILYILGAIIGFLAFAFSMTFVDSASILILVGIVGLSGMMYFISKIVNLKKLNS